VDDFRDSGWRPDPAHFAQELLAYADALFNLAYHLTGSDHDGQDLVQETFARAVAASRSFQGGNLKAWLVRILRNAYIDQYRRQQHNPVMFGLEDADELPSRDPLAGELDLAQSQRLLGAEIEKALQSLPPHAREVILLDYEGLTEAEVAEVLGCAVGTIKSRLARARALLRQKLAG
jgi:RNA polymerase sigma factor (sigma-70 family)